MRGRILDAVEQAERRLVFGDASPRMFEQRAWRTTGPPLRVRERPKNKVTRGQPAKPAEALRRPKYGPAARRFKAQKRPSGLEHAGLKLRNNLPICITPA